MGFKGTIKTGKSKKRAAVADEASKLKDQKKARSLEQANLEPTKTPPYVGEKPTKTCDVDEQIFYIVVKNPVHQAIIRKQLTPTKGNVIRNVRKLARALRALQKREAS